MVLYYKIRRHFNEGPPNNVRLVVILRYLFLHTLSSVKGRNWSCIIYEVTSCVSKDPLKGITSSDVIYYGKISNSF